MLFSSVQSTNKNIIACLYLILIQIESVKLIYSPPIVCDRARANTVTAPGMGSWGFESVWPIPSVKLGTSLLIPS